MKKSKKIQLVLITAVLASCNRSIFPSQPDPVYDPGYVQAGPGYIQAHTDTDSVYSSSPDACWIDPAMYDCYPPYYYLNAYYPGWSFSWYSAPRLVYRSHSISRRRSFIPRGGFGKTAVTAVS